jgi:ParB family chromosome partitioning protein
VLNPRARNKQVFARLVENISALGLKRPITVAPTTSGTEPFEIVCGQGRFEAFQALGEKKIPCIVVSASEADRYLIGLVENLARRKHSNRELLTSIQILSDRGYTCQQIADKTCLDSGYIHGILVLLRQGEERLIAAVEKGWLSIKLAMEIARSKDVDLQKAMMEAYESGVLKGEQLMRVRRLIDKRKTFGKRYGQQAPRTEKPTPQKLLHAYQLEVRRQKVMIKKSDINEQRLLIIVTTMRKLLADDYFRTLLRNEEMPDMPKPLADRIVGETQ